MGAAEATEEDPVIAAMCVVKITTVVGPTLTPHFAVFSAKILRNKLKGQRPLATEKRRKS